MTKQEIIKTAFKVWGREQYQSTSLVQLARELGVSKSALYRHFKNKQALLEAMYESFFDEYAAFIKPEYDKAVAAQDIVESFFIMIRIMVEYYIRHRDMFIFSLVRLYGDYDMGSMTRRLLSRGIDLRYFLRVEKDALAYPSLIQLIIGHLSFVICYFHRPDQTSEALGSDRAVDEMLSFMKENISFGLGLDKALIDALDYQRLEALCPGRNCETCNDESILKAVAGAVAEAGPWEASMDMIARRSGLSKSGLYSHFKSKQDMLKQLFMTEFDRILEYIEEGIALSAVPEEQLYLAVFSAADYFRTRSEILLAADWIRTRRLNLGITLPPRLYQVFSYINLKVPGTQQAVFTPAVVDRLGQMILFLIVHTFMHRPEGMSLSELPNNGIRRLFRFIVLGMKGF
ncbi:MAG: TetR/AcrR family transcriptional regulator [Treponema sp.]|jgi:AcrR family transcriptional regulator|nr:TetR/AcrR family transcriptional regulator [Treponema sp.]